MAQGAVDQETGNVPLVLSGGFKVHFLGADPKGLRVRIGKSLGYVGDFEGFADLWVFLVQMRLPGPTTSMTEVIEWVGNRKAERQ